MKKVALQTIEITAEILNRHDEETNNTITSNTKQYSTKHLENQR